MSDSFELLTVAPDAPAGRMTVYAPFDREQIGQVHTCGATHIEQALAAAQRNFERRDQWIVLHERIAILERAAALMSQRADALALEAAREGGKPLPDSQVEVARAIDGMRLCIEVLRSEQGEVIAMGGTAGSAHRAAFTLREPIGVVVAVSAFNHPLNLIVHQVAAAVASGCPVIVKPAADTPLSCWRFVKILHEAGLPLSWCQCVITPDLALAEALVTDSRVAFFSFIGSARVGWMLRSKLSPGTRCALEHGGAAPVLLAADADLVGATASITKGGYYHAGQVCVSVQRVFAERSIAESFAQGLAEAATALRIGDPTCADTEVGPLIRPRETERVAQWVQEAVAGGAQHVCGGDALSASTYPCTVLLEPPADAKVSTQEIFGPVVCVYAYDELDEAIARANSLPFAFQAAVYTAQLETALRAYRQLRASAVMLNDHTAFRVDGMPFAGLGQSGLGVGGIGHTMRDMQIEKMLVIRSEQL